MPIKVKKPLISNKTNILTFPKPLKTLQTLMIIDDIIQHKRPLVLAPIAGFTDTVFRKICVKHGCSLTFTELISSAGIVRNNQKTLDMLKFAKEEQPIAIQIFGNEPEIMAEAATIVEGLSPALIDINMGCPARKVCGSQSGAFLLRNPLLINKITEAVVKKVKTPVSAKIRTGWDNDNKNYLEVVKALEDGGISLISVHGRTRDQGYSGSADWNIINEISSIAKVPVIGNGDIKSYEQAMDILKNTGCSAIMIGRGAIGNPWIFSGHKPDVQEIKEQIKEHLFMLIEEYGDWGIKLMRKHIVKYIHSIKNAASLRSRIIQSMDIEEILTALDMLEEAS